MSKFEGSSIRGFFDGRSILVTGGTGFLGASLIQRLLATTTIKTIYLLIRDKGHLTMATRANQFLRCSMFKSLPSNAVKKIVPIKGDVSIRNLGLLYPVRKQILDDVTIVFNCAATVEWEGPMSEALEHNVFSTTNVIEFCEQFRHPTVLVHTSTCAAWSNHDVLEERIPISESWTKYNQLLSDAAIYKQFASQLTKDVVGEYPNHVNSYAFSKSMAELVVQNFAVNNVNSDLQIVTVRLPGLCGALREPSPGHVATFQAASLLLCSVALGRIQNSSYWPLEATFRSLPVDMCSNALIAISAAVGRRLISYDIINVGPKRGEVPSIKDIFKFAAEAGNEYPSLTQIAPPMVMSKFDIVNMLRMRLNELKLDWMTSRRGTTSSVTEVVDMTRRLKRVAARDEDLENLDKVLAHLSADERELFYFDTRAIDWKANIRETFLQFRRQQLEEDDGNLTLARRRMAGVKLLWNATDYIIMLIALLTVALLMGLL